MTAPNLVEKWSARASHLLTVLHIVAAAMLLLGRRGTVEPGCQEEAALFLDFPLRIPRDLPEVTV